MKSARSTKNISSQLQSTKQVKNQTHKLSLTSKNSTESTARNSLQSSSEVSIGPKLKKTSFITSEFVVNNQKLQKHKSQKTSNTGTLPSRQNSATRIDCSSNSSESQRPLDLKTQSSATSLRTRQNINDLAKKLGPSSVKSSNQTKKVAESKQRVVNKKKSKAASRSTSRNPEKLSKKKNSIVPQPKIRQNYISVTEQDLPVQTEGRISESDICDQNESLRPQRPPFNDKTNIYFTNYKTLEHVQSKELIAQKQNHSFGSEDETRSHCEIIETTNHQNNIVTTATETDSVPMQMVYQPKKANKENKEMIVIDKKLSDQRNQSYLFGSKIMTDKNKDNALSNKPLAQQLHSTGIQVKGSVMRNLNPPTKYYATSTFMTLASQKTEISPVSKLIVSSPIKAKVVPSMEEELEDISIENSTVFRSCNNNVTFLSNHNGSLQQPEASISVASDTVECSCSECMKGYQSNQMTASCSVSQASSSNIQQVNIETILVEEQLVCVIRDLLVQFNSTGDKQSSQNILEELLKSIHGSCCEWWNRSQELYNLHMLFSCDEVNSQNELIGRLISKSLTMSVVSIGFLAQSSLQQIKIAITKTDHQRSNRFNGKSIHTEFFQVSSSLQQLLEVTYKLVMSLVSTVLGRMDQDLINRNPYSIQLYERLQAYQESSISSSNQQHSQDDLCQMQSLFQDGCEEITELLKLVCTHQLKCYPNLLGMFKTFLEIIDQSQSIQFDQAKDLVMKAISCHSPCNQSSQSEPQSMNRTQQQKSQALKRAPSDLTEVPEHNDSEDFSSSCDDSIGDPKRGSFYTKQTLRSLQNQLEQKKVQNHQQYDQVQLNCSEDFTSSYESAGEYFRTNDGNRLNSRGQQNQRNTLNQQQCELVQLSCSSDLTWPEQAFSQKIPNIKTPFLPARRQDDSRQYTLILDMDETLLHFSEVSVQNPENSSEIHQSFLARPYCVEFLQGMSQFFEIVIFTAGEQTYADSVLDNLPGNEHIDHRLYRQHVVQLLNNFTQDIKFVKDISLIGRDLSKVLFVDNLAENFSRQKENGIQVTTWIDDPYDDELVVLAQHLTQMVQGQFGDVRQWLSQFEPNFIMRKSRQITDEVFSQSSQSNVIIQTDEDQVNQ